jgi:hypothetical protein
LIFHPNGTANFHDVETFSGTVNGVPGTVTFDLNGSSDPALVVSATAVIVSTTGADCYPYLFEGAGMLFKRGQQDD